MREFHVPPSEVDDITLTQLAEMGIFLEEVAEAMDPKKGKGERKRPDTVFRKGMSPEQARAEVAKLQQQKGNGST